MTMYMEDTNYPLGRLLSSNYILRMVAQAINGDIHITHSRSVSCTLLFGHGDKMITKSCTNWHFTRHETLKYRLDCKG